MNKEGVGGNKTNRVARLLQGLGPIVITLVTPCHVVYDIIRVSKVVGGAKCSVREKVWRGRHSGESQGFHSIYRYFTIQLPLDILDSLNYWRGYFFVILS